MMQMMQIMQVTLLWKFQILPVEQPATCGHLRPLEWLQVAASGCFFELQIPRVLRPQWNNEYVPVVPARGRAEAALGLYYKVFFIYRACVRRSPARPMRACFVRKWRAVPNVSKCHTTSHLKLHTSHFALHTALFTLHTPHFISSHLSSSQFISVHRISSLLISSLIISSHLISSLLICHLNSSRLFSSHLITAPPFSSHRSSS